MEAPPNHHDRHHDHHHHHNSNHQQDHDHGHHHDGQEFDVPSDELDHLDQMAEAHSRQNSVALRKVNQQVVSLLLPYIQDQSGFVGDNSNRTIGPSHPFKVLDYGCGAGGISIFLAQQLKTAAMTSSTTSAPADEERVTPPISIVGVDITPGMIAQAQENLQKESSLSSSLPPPSSPTLKDQITFHLLSNRMPTAQDLLSLSSLSPSGGADGYDLIVTSFVLGHIAPKEAGKRIVKILASTLKPGGKLALAEFLYPPERQHQEQQQQQHGEDHGHQNIQGHGEGHHAHEHNHEHSHHHEHEHHHEHIEFSLDEVRELFVGCNLFVEPASPPVADASTSMEQEEGDLPVTKFEFEWGGHTIKSFLAVGTKQ